MLHFETSDSMDEVQEFFKSACEDAGIDSSQTSATALNGVENASMEFGGDGRSLNIQITRSGAGKPLMVQVGYEEKK